MNGIENTSPQQKSWRMKIILIGEASVGKTSLIHRFIDNKFKEDFKISIGIDVMTKEIVLSSEENAVLTIWDMGGQERFKVMREQFYRMASGALLVFDLTRHETLVAGKNWLEDVRQVAGEDIPFVLIGNKIDLVKDVGEVADRKEARSFAESENSIYIETSAKTGINVEEAFIDLTHRILDSLKQD